MNLTHEMQEDARGIPRHNSQAAAATTDGHGNAAERGT